MRLAARLAATAALLSCARAAMGPPPATPDASAAGKHCVVIGAGFAGLSEGARGGGARARARARARA